MPRIASALSLLVAAAALVAGCDRSADEGEASNLGDSSATHNSSTRPATTRAAGSGVPERLYGAWIAEDVDVSMGEAKVKLVFKDDGPVKIMAWSDMPFVGQVRDKSAPYEVSGDTISSDAIRGGTTVKYRFEGEQLVIEYQDGKTVRFDRA